MQNLKQGSGTQKKCKKSAKKVPKSEKKSAKKK